MRNPKADASASTRLPSVGVCPVNGPRRWPLLVIALPAAVAVWSGWVGLGALCGFGLVQPLPGIVAWHLDTAITLPVGVEAYGTYALGAYLHPATPDRARSFAGRSAIGALLLGMFGQIAYHLLAAAHRTRAPWLVVVFVACLPVVALGFGAMLTHLLRAVPGPAGADPGPCPDEPEAPAPDAEFDRIVAYLASGSNGVPAVPELHQQAAERFAPDLLAGRLPRFQDIKDSLHVGQDKAAGVRAYLSTLVPGTGGAPHA